jgi:hypothetical protein
MGFLSRPAWLLAAALVLGSAPANATIVGDASVPYSATRTIAVDGHSYVDHVFHVPGKEREEVNLGGIPVYFILNLDRDRAAAILPALASYLEFPLPPLLARFDRRWLIGKMGDRTILDHQRATKFRLDYTAGDGSRGVGVVWVSDDNILLGLKGRVLRPHQRPIRIEMMLSHLKIGPQAEELFDIPHGLHKIPSAALLALLNMRAPKPR